MAFKLLEDGSKKLLENGSFKLLEGGAPAGPPITVTGVGPATGTTAGGTTVTITGTGLLPAVAVKFGGIDAQLFTVVNDGQITAISPAHAAGTVQIVVS